MYYNNELRLAMRVVWSVFYVVWARVVVWGKKKRKKACRKTHVHAHVHVHVHLHGHASLLPSAAALCVSQPGPEKKGRQPCAWIR
jgi:hypothetical protein